MSLGMPSANNVSLLITAMGEGVIDQMRTGSAIRSGDEGSQQFLRELRQYLRADGRIYLYGCSTGAGAAGEQFLMWVAKQTGVPVTGYTNYLGLNGYRIPIYCPSVTAYPNGTIERSWF